MLGEIGDTAQVAMNGQGGVVAELQIFQHALAQGGHAGAYSPHEWTPSGEKLTIAAWMSRGSRRSHCGPDRGQRRDGRNDGEDRGKEGILPERSEWFRSTAAYRK